MSDTKDTQDKAARDYRATLFLPATDFPMKAGLPEAEPKWLAHWQAMDLYGRVRKAAKGRELFVLHDGPIYANGDIHSGTGLNHILKDFVVRSQTMLGKDAPYVPGWDCHGLPIEWKVEEQYRAEGKSKDDVPKDELRRDCRAFAQHWLGVQREQIKRLGCTGEWDHPYTTMDFRAEAAIVREAHKFAMNGLLYRGFRPVMWSPVEKTALAEAEIEYHEKTSPTIYVKFPVVKGPNELKGVSIVIWTTTPWTIPGNRAVAYSASLNYTLLRPKQFAKGRPLPVSAADLTEDEREIARTATKQSPEEYAAALTDLAKESLQAQEQFGLDGIVVASDRVRHVLEVTKTRAIAVEQFEFGPHLLEGVVVAHPLRGKGYNFDVPLLPGDHVTADTGTGFVHTAPGHGEEDFELILSNFPDYARTNPDAFAIVREDGSFAPNVPLFGGKFILSRDGKKDGDANGAVIKELIDAGALLAKGSLRHSYPHSWRSKAPVIYRATPQWFASMDKPFTGSNGKTLRQLAVQGIADTRWYPAAGANRIGAMVESRPDWVLSRQRAWGVPLAIFFKKETGEILKDEKVNARIQDAFAKEGADAWFTSPPSRFLGDTPGEWEQAKDILDVWFDSGSTHVFTVEEPLRPEWPQAEKADLYLEGSDQHRGWFQSSLLESCGTRGHAPYKAVLTHGFVLDDQGRKMSKSLGNTLAPKVIAEKNGADILRLWAASSDFVEDLRIGGDIINANVDAYRRLRNTIRFMLANLAGFDESERIDHAQMPELERYMLAMLADLDATVREGYAAFDFNRVFNTLFNFCTNELSAFYFDVRKDSLYCDAIASARRRSARTATDEIFRRIVTWLAPILVFTMEEAWTLRFGKDDSVHLHTFLETPKNWRDEKLIAKWNRIRALRRVVTGALELKRKDKVIGASLEARPVLYVTDSQDAELLKDIDLGEICITSNAKVSTHSTGDDVTDVETVGKVQLLPGKGIVWPSGAFVLTDIPGAAAMFHHAEGDKCARCWMILPEVGKNPKHPDLCNRCSGVMDSLEGAA